MIMISTRVYDCMYEYILYCYVKLFVCYIEGLQFHLTFLEHIVSTHDIIL